MAEIIHIQQILQARRKQREQEYLCRCVELIGESLRVQLSEFELAPDGEKPLRAAKIRKLGELMEYTSQLL